MPEPTEGPLTFEELQLATRNRGMPLEGLRYDVTPTGMHYLLVHFDIPEIDTTSWRLSVGGNVERAQDLSIEDIRALPSQTLTVTLECAGNGRARLTPRPLSNPWLVEAIGTADWTGTSLRNVLERAGLLEGTRDVAFFGADSGVQGDEFHSYGRALRPDVASRDEVMLVYEMNGRPLEPQHGYPLRLLVPGWYGMASVKWLTRIEALTETFDGYQQRTAYRFKLEEDEQGDPVNEIRVRALMIPPGYPDFFTRKRFVERGTVTLQGRAWAGPVAIARVEVGVDGTWSDAQLGQRVGPFAWQSWTFEWDAIPGDHELSVRATDAHGNTQPLEQPWNYQGMGNNLVQVVAVSVT